MGDRPQRVHRRLLAVNPTGIVSGAELALLRLLDAARNDGWDVAVAAPPGPLVARIEALGLRRVEIPDLKLAALPRVLAVPVTATRWLRAAPALHRAASGADLVLTNGLLALPALRFARIRAPVVWFVHDVIGRRDRLALLRRFGSVVDVAIAPSDAVTPPLRARGLEIRLVRNGTLFPVAPAPVVAPAPPVVGAVALLTQWKGLHVLLDAVGRLARDDVVVEIMGGVLPGDESYAAGLHHRAAEPDLAGRVRFLGQVAEPLERMRGWALMVSASVEPEAAPLSVLEAMSIGLPIVGTDHGGTPEVLGDAGLLVEPGDVEAMATAIERLLDDAVLRQRCAQAGPRIVANGLTLEQNTAGLLGTLGEVADGVGT
ncbi:MAG TPA: glycosyltransferase family 4 protein [Acidimicrobiia bacterium]